VGKQEKIIVSGKGREEILARIRAATGNQPRTTAQRQQLEKRLSDPPIAVAPAVVDDPVRQFIAKAEANQFTVHRIASLQLFLPAVREILPSETTPPDISISPELRHLGWPSDWTVNFGPGRMIEPWSVTAAIAGIAETGSIVFRSDKDNPTTLNFLPENQIAALRVADILSYPEDLWPRLKKFGSGWPRAVNIVAGPSRTADVGGVIVRPAHGPKSVHLILIDG
jgi:L-lactate dehydrogenase complex protein LldG